MIVVIGTNIPNRVRGVLKIWLIEIKAGVFIGDVNIVIENRVVDFIKTYLNSQTDLLVVRNVKNLQGFEILQSINFTEKIQNISGLVLSKKTVQTSVTVNESHQDDLMFD